MFKDIIVNLGAGKRGKIVGDYAISVASRLEAHITGIAIAFVPDNQAAGTALIPVEKIEALQRDHEVAAQTVVDWFAAATARAGVSAEKRILRANCLMPLISSAILCGGSILRLSAKSNPTAVPSRR